MANQPAKKAAPAKAADAPKDEKTGERPGLQPVPEGKDPADPDTFVVDPADVDPAGKTEREVLDELHGADPVDVARNSYPDELHGADPVDVARNSYPDALHGADPVDVARNSYPDALPAAVDATPPASVYVVEPDKAVTRADVAALQGVQVAPDTSLVDVVDAKDVFISEGMRNDLEIHGHAVDPNTGRKIVKE